MTDQNHFLIRKLHSLLGLFPVGAFFFEHTLTNSFTLIGADLWEKWCWCLHNLPFKVPIEILFIFIPLAFHALYGLWIVYVAKNNALRYTYWRNWAFYLQRITALITIVFVTWHVWALKAAELFVDSGGFVNFHNYLTSSPIILAVYVIGWVSAVFHFSNGIWGFLASWGITIGPRAQSYAYVACMLVFCLFTAAGLAALYQFVTVSTVTPLYSMMY